MNVLSPLRWPRWHRMPPPTGPFPVRWSYEAWVALYPFGCAQWKPWPWGPHPDSWAAMPDFLRNAVASDPNPARIIEYVQRVMRDEALKPKPFIPALIHPL